MEENSVYRLQDSVLKGTSRYFLPPEEVGLAAVGFATGGPEVVAPFVCTLLDHGFVV